VSQYMFKKYYVNQLIYKFIRIIFYKIAQGVKKM